MTHGWLEGLLQMAAHEMALLRLKTAAAAAESFEQLTCTSYTPT